MNVGKDPFPRDEVTGLAAFDHIEPLRSHSVVPEESVETPVLTDESGEAESGLQARVPSADASNTQRERVDATLPLDLSAMPHWQGTAAPQSESESAFVEEDAGEELSPSALPARRDATLSGAPAPALEQDSGLDAMFSGESAPVLPQPIEATVVPAPMTGASGAALDTISSGAAMPAQQQPSALDAMFSEAAGAGWDDEDEATRVHSHPAGRAPSSATLDMEEWDEDEPATEMKPFAMFDTPPLAARPDEWSNPDDATSTYLPPRGGTGIRSATPTIRATTPPLQTKLPPAQSRANALSGGRPSPFPTGQQIAPEPASLLEERDEPDEARASAFDGLLPVPAPQLAAALSGAHRHSGSERSERSSELPVAASGALWKSGEHKAQLPARFLEALKAGHRPSIVIAVSGFVGLLALGLIVRAIAAGGVGTAVLEVSPADAQVQVDGKPVSGTSSPYMVSELTPGNHEIVVTKPGYSDYRGTFPVSAGANTKLPVIELAASSRDVGFSVRSVPTGAAVWVDGAQTDLVTPAKLTGIKPGIHRLALKHEGYSDYELQMFVPDATVLQLPAAELVALPAAPEEPVRASKRSRRSLSADAAESYSPRRSRRSEGSESDRPSRAERAERAERASYTSSYSSRRSRAANSGDVVSPRSGPAAETGRMGTLRLNSRPWAQVTVDGRPIGNTPQQNLQLSPGKHKLQLSNPQLGLAKSVTINIKAGETQTQVVNLAE